MWISPLKPKIWNQHLLWKQDTRVAFFYQFLFHSLLFEFEFIIYWLIFRRGNIQEQISSRRHLQIQHAGQQNSGVRDGDHGVPRPMQKYILQVSNVTANDSERIMHLLKLDYSMESYNALNLNRKKYLLNYCLVGYFIIHLIIGRNNTISQI